jgi:hypothetical protein
MSAAERVLRLVKEIYQGAAFLAFVYGAMFGMALSWVIKEW